MRSVSGAPTAPGATSRQAASHHPRSRAHAPRQRFDPLPKGVMACQSGWTDAPRLSRPGRGCRKRPAGRPALGRRSQIRGPPAVGAVRGNRPARADGGAQLLQCPRSFRGPGNGSAMTHSTRHDPIGIPGRPWGELEKALWRSRQSRRRSYADEVLAAIEPLRARFEVSEYGRLDYAPDGSYPLLAIRSRDWDDALPCALDRKSTRLNSSHVQISYAVFCLKK